MITGLLNGYTAFVTIEDPVEGVVQLTPGEANVRVPVIIHPQQAFDVPRRGDTPARPAKVQVVTFFHDQKQWSEEALVAGQIIFDSPNASRPRGAMAPWGERVNIASPQHQAYGSLFQASEPTYGMG